MEINRPKQNIEGEGGRQLQILGAEDDPSMRAMEERVFGVLGVAFRSVANAQEGLRELGENPTKYQVVISDRDMPGMNGEDFLEEVRRIYPSIQTTLVSGRKYEGVELELLKKRGVDSYIQKPFSLAQIESFIEEARQVLEERSNQNDI